MGWKDDLKDLLNEIYSFSKPGAVNPSHIIVPSDIEAMSKSMILQHDQNKSTELMRAALREVLSPTTEEAIAIGNSHKSHSFGTSEGSVEPHTMVAVINNATGITNQQN